MNGNDTINIIISLGDTNDIKGAGHGPQTSVCTNKTDME